MRRSPRPFACLLLAAAAITASVPAFADEADTLFDKGLAAYKEGKPEEALVSYQAAWKLRKTQDLATVLGQVEMLLGKHRDAAEHLAYALRYFPVSGKKELRATMEKALADAKAKVTEARVSVTGDAPAHEIRVDGAVIDPAVVGTSVFVLPGKHVIEASAKGYVTARQTIEATEGATVDVVLALVAEQAGGERSMLLPAIAFGVGGAGLVLGAITAGVAAAKTADLTKVCGDALVCPPSERGNLDGATTTAHVSTVGFVLAGVGAAVGVTLLLVPLGARPTSQARVLIGPGFLGVKGAF